VKDSNISARAGSRLNMAWREQTKDSLSAEVKYSDSSWRLLNAASCISSVWLHDMAGWRRGEPGCEVWMERGFSVLQSGIYWYVKDVKTR